MKLSRFCCLLALVTSLVLTIVRPSFAKEPNDETNGRFQVAALALPSIKGTASWYGGRHVGRPTASGEIYSAVRRTAAHRNLPFGTLIRITNLRNGRATVARVNDRGPFVAGRFIDLSERAARDLAMLNAGLASVRVEVLSYE